MNRTVLTIGVTGILIAAVGCEKANSEQNSASASTAPQIEPSAWVLSSAPEDAVSITDARSSMNEGESVVIRGRIGGRQSAISSASPVFTIVDLGLPYCGELEDDGCSTPWDYCCETPEDVASNSVTVQIIGDGEIDPVAGGLEALDEVIVIGTVGPRPNETVFTIRATGVYLVGG